MDTGDDNKQALPCPLGRMGWSVREVIQVSLTVPTVISWSEGTLSVRKLGGSAQHVQLWSAQPQNPWGHLVKALRPSQSFLVGLTPHSLCTCFKINYLENLQRTQWNKDCWSTTLVTRTCAAMERSSLSSLFSFSLIPESKQLFTQQNNKSSQVFDSKKR